jgi:hypothetical protein
VLGFPHNLIKPADQRKVAARRDGVAPVRAVAQAHDSWLVEALRRAFRHAVDQGLGTSRARKQQKCSKLFVHFGAMWWCSCAYTSGWGNASRFFAATQMRKASQLNVQAPYKHQQTLPDMPAMSTCGPDHLDFSNQSSAPVLAATGVAGIAFAVLLAHGGRELFAWHQSQASEMSDEVLQSLMMWPL